MKIRLVTTDPWSPSLELVAERLPALLGSSPEADIQIDDRRISPMHCEFRLDNGQVRVRDLNSEHGLLVNQQPVQHALLESGDLLTVGIRVLRISFRTTNKAAPHEKRATDADRAVHHNVDGSSLAAI
jgi:pSer/pThr/pTyr-binding forkhead associated (FHA) protein